MRRAILAVALSLGLAACGELPQEGMKPFVKAEETLSMGAPLAGRTAHQDEYPRTRAH